MTRLGRLAEEIGFVVKAARPGFWLTSIWFYLVPAGGRNVFHQPEFWLGLFYVTFPLGLLIYGWNDIVDFEVDRFNPRKGTYLFGARGTPERLARLPWRIALVQVPFAVLFTLLLGPRALAWLAALIVAAALYNCRPFAFKGRPGLDLLNQAGYLLVFVLASWLNHVSQVPWFTFVFGAMFAMHSHLFGEIMDLEPDRRAGRRSLAGVLGARPAKWLLVEVGPRSVARRVPRRKRGLVHAGRDAPVARSTLFAGRDAVLVSRLECCGPGVNALGVARGYAGANVVAPAANV